MESSILRLNASMEQVELHPFAGGTAALYSTPSPGRVGANQDSIGIIALGEREGLLAVADGAGGHANGDRASAMAIESLATSIEEAETQVSVGRESILNGFERANRDILSWGSGSATTLAAIEIREGRIRPYHCGDSTILVVGQRGRIKLKTASHSPVGHAIEAGILETDDSLHHEELHLVSNSLGSTEMRIELGAELTLSPRDTAIVASDGLFDNLYLNEIVESIRKGPLLVGVGFIIQLAKERMVQPDPEKPSKPDDLSVIVFRMNK